MRDRDKVNLMEDNNLQKNAVTLMRKIRQEILQNPKKAYEIIKDLEQDERFDTDPYFSCAIMVQKISVLTFLGDHDQIKAIIKKVYEMIITIDNYDIYLEGLTRLAVAYYETGDQEQAIRLYTKAHEKEVEEHKITIVSAMAYNNIATIYYVHNKFDEARFYYQKAYEVFEEQNLIDSNNLDNFGLYVYMLAYLSIIEFKTQNNDKAIYYLNILDEIGQHKIPEVSLAIYKKLKVYYYKSLGEKEKVVATSIEILDLFHKSKDYFMISQFLLEFYEHGIELGLAEESLIKIITDNLDIIGDNVSDNELRNLCLIILQYAIANNDDDLMIKYYNKFSRVMVKVEQENDVKKSELIDLHIDLSHKKKNAKKIAEQNEQLNELNEEIKTKSIRLKQLYDQSRIITRIGQKITAISNIDSIQKTLNKEFLALMPFNSMALFTKLHEDDYVASYVYDGNTCNYIIKLDLEDETSISAMVIRDGEARITGNLHEEDYFILRDDESITDHPNKSAIFYPIKFDAAVIAVLAIQCAEANAYQKQHLELIEALEPYVAIAIINWKRSNNLNEKIESLQKDKRELKKLLTYHRKLSNIDLLTRIPNRRYFNSRLSKLIKIAKKEKMILHLFMFDIDNFKLYNDLNGHVKGDQVLITVVDELKKLRQVKNTILARYGGEEFIAAELSFSHDDAVEKARLSCQTVEQLNIKYHNGTDENLTISLGMLSVSYDKINEVEILIDEVDKLLYEAKNTGKNKAVCKLITGGK